MSSDFVYLKMQVQFRSINKGARKSILRFQSELGELVWETGSKSQLAVRASSLVPGEALKIMFGVVSIQGVKSVKDVGEGFPAELKVTCVQELIHEAVLTVDPVAKIVAWLKDMQAKRALQKYQERMTQISMTSGASEAWEAVKAAREEEQWAQVRREKRERRLRRELKKIFGVDVHTPTGFDHVCELREMDDFRDMKYPIHPDNPIGRCVYAKKDVRRDCCLVCGWPAERK